jgi:hypothetical protein
MADLADVSTKDALYEADEFAWIERQIALLRAGDIHRLDRDHLIEYLSDMAARDRRELESRLTVLYAHILKFQIQPGRASRSWRSTIAEQQRAIRQIMKSLPSLGKRALAMVPELYPDAIKAAAIETGIDPASIPSIPEFDLAELMSFNPMQDPTALPITPDPPT